MKNERYANYADALYQFARDEGKISAYREAMKLVVSTFADNPSFGTFLASYAVPQERQFALLEEVFASLDTPELVPFLKLVTARHLIPHLSDIADCFIQECNEALGIREGIVYSTALLSKDDLAKIQSALEERLGVKVYLHNQADTNLIGGVKVAIDGKVFDGSIQARWEALRNQLLKGGTL